MISIIDMDSRIRRIAQESLSTLGVGIEVFGSPDEFVISHVSSRTNLLILGHSDPTPEQNIALLTLVLQNPDLLTYPLSIGNRGACKLIEFYERQITVAPESQARLVSFLILLRQADPSVRSTSLDRFFSEWRKAFGLPTHGVVPSSIADAGFQIVQQQRLLTCP